MKFRKIPVLVDAVQWRKFGDLKAVDHYRHPKGNGNRTCPVCDLPMVTHGWILGLDGGHRVCPGDWVVTGVNGEHYPVKPKIFETTYEPEPSAL